MVLHFDIVLSFFSRIRYRIDENQLKNSWSMKAISNSQHPIFFSRYASLIVDIILIFLDQQAAGDLIEYLRCKTNWFHENPCYWVRVTFKLGRSYLWAGWPRAPRLRGPEPQGLCGLHLRSFFLSAGYNTSRGRKMLSVCLSAPFWTFHNGITFEHIELEGWNLLQSVHNGNCSWDEIDMIVRLLYQLV